MSAEQTRRAIRTLDDEITKLSKKSAVLGGKEATLQSHALRIKNSVSKNTSMSSLKSKQSQIDRYEKEATKAASEKADIDGKIADKKKKRDSANIKLQKEEAAERNKEIKMQAEIQCRYEQQIESLTEKLKSQIFAALPQMPYDSMDDGEEYDVFVSHAWEDKESFVNEFIAELKVLGIKAWYDQSQITWGDSMREKIERGLSKSRFGVVVISPNYIAEGKYWTKAELDGLFQLESVNGKKILPIWHDITKKEVINYSSIIAGRLAMNTASMTPKEIANRLVELLPPVNAEETTEELEETTDARQDEI